MKHIIALAPMVVAISLISCLKFVPFGWLLALPCCFWLSTALPKYWSWVHRSK